MEFGDHCAYEKCARLDFLPFKCEKCCKTFCKDHKLPDHHDCIDIPETLSGDDRASSNDSPKSHPCTVEGCKRRELVPVTCPQCSGAFCLQHRHQVDHECSALQQKPLKLHTSPCPPAANSKERFVAPSIGAVSQTQKKPLSDKAARMEAKVRLMKLKMKAEGSPSVPQAERMFFSVRLPQEHSGVDLPAACPMFFSREWSVGRVVDFIAQKHKLLNDNHVPQAPKRLVLYNSTGQPFEMSRVLNSLNSLFNGDTITLKYISREPSSSVQ